MSKIVLKLKADPNSLPIVFGISSHENDYRLSWAINQKFNIHLAQQPEHQVFHPKLKIFRDFSCYQYTDPVSDVSYTLLSNRCDNGFMLEKHRNIDFILIVDDIAQYGSTIEVQSMLKLIPLVYAVIPIDYTELHKNNII